MNWDDLRFLTAIHRHRSFARAARALGVDATTISRKLAALERDLGARLVRRVADGHALTPEADAVLPLVEQIELSALAIERRARDKAERAAGTIRVTAGDGLTNYVLAPSLPRLRAANPELRVDLLGDLAVLDIVRREADVALRLVRPQGPALVASKLGSMSYAIYASEPYLRGRRPPATIADLRDHDWLDYLHAGAHARAFARLRGQLAGARVVARTTTTTTMLQACAAGVGLALLLRRIADGDPRLVRILPQASVPARDAWVVYHKDDRQSPRVRAVVRWLKEIL